MNQNNSKAGRIFDICNHLFLLVFAVMTVIPFVYVLAGSFASNHQLSTESFFLIPKEFTLRSYKFILSSNTLPRALGVSVYVTLVGTIINLFFTVTMAYPLSKKNLVGKNILLNMIIFSMLFSGGLIPTFLIVKACGLLDKLMALILPGAISSFNLIVVRNFFQSIPDSLEESATIDGCTELGILFKIVLPLSTPVLATFALFYAVGHWNAFFNALIYISSPEKWPLQVLLRQIVMLSQLSMAEMSDLGSATEQIQNSQGIKMAVIVVATVPILCVYPFLQKYFAKGVMIGAIKG